jgi:23S rRNA pseudouridine2605 synthase
VTVNGEITTQLGTRIDPLKDVVCVDQRTIIATSSSPIVFYALYKPRFCVTTLNDPQGRETILRHLPETRHRLIPVGRLDYDAEGLLLLTNNGDIANRIMHPAYHIWKQYFVKVRGRINQTETQRWLAGPIIDGQRRQPVKVRILHYINDKTWLAVSLQEGIKHHLKKMFGDSGFPVLKIKRYRIANIELKEMAPGESRLLSEQEVSALLTATGAQTR